MFRSREERQDRGRRGVLMLRKDEASAIAISRAQEKRTDARQETDSSRLTTDHIPQTTNHKPQTIKPSNRKTPGPASVLSLALVSSYLASLSSALAVLALPDPAGGKVAKQGTCSAFLPCLTTNGKRACCCNCNPAISDLK